MNTAVTLAKRFREVILNGTWIANTNFRQELEHIDWTIAATQTAHANTIAVLAQHIHYYINGVNQVFSGGALEIRDQFSFDFPPMTSQAQWHEFLSRFWGDAETFAQHVEKMSDETLRSDFVNQKYGSYARNIEAMIEHSYYHLGQIVLIRKLLTA